jgi:hypothetical protein
MYTTKFLLDISVGINEKNIKILSGIKFRPAKNAGLEYLRNASRKKLIGTAT